MPELSLVHSRGAPTDTADFKSYCRFFDEHLNNPKRDIFSGQLMAKVDGQYQPAKSLLPVLRAYALEEDHIKKSHVADYLARYELTKEPELLVDLPEYDPTTDYLWEIVKHIQFANLSQRHAYELLLEFGSRMFQRFEDPAIQNPMIILLGPQSAGKSYLLNAIFGGLEQFFIEFTVYRDERDMLATLNQGFVMNVDEVDRLLKIKNDALLKTMLTKQHTFVRLPGDRVATRRPVRCSFVGSTNTDHIFTDSTGLRRFRVFHIKSVDFNYPDNCSLEILSQFKHHAKASYRASEAAIESITSYMEARTPVDVNRAMLSHWDAALATLEQSQPDCTGLFKLADVKYIMEEIQAEFDIKRQRLQQLLNGSGRTKRISAGNRYRRLV